MGAINGEASEPVGFASYQLDAGTNLSCQVVQASPNLLSYLHVMLNISKNYASSVTLTHPRLHLRPQPPQKTTAPIGIWNR